MVRSGAVAAVVLVLALAACAPGGRILGSAARKVPADASQGLRPDLALDGDGVDVPAPNVFEVTDKGLWDGRPSLGGVWVAHPDVTEPERVLIRNPGNGTSVVGALFRRERDNPGPEFQVSAEAAAALEMLAGAPATLKVTALRRQSARADVAPATAPVATSAASPAQEPAPKSGPVSGPVSGPSQPALNAGAPATGGLVQIGIFSREANADMARARLEGVNIPARVIREESQSRPLWRVVAGPPRGGTQADLVARVRALGFADAYGLAR